MPNIKPISDLRNYSEVLRDVTIDSPVFLTKNGRGRYAIMDIQDYERLMATIKLMGALETGRKSGEEQGWISSEQLKSELEILKKVVYKNHLTECCKNVKIQPR